MIATGNQPVTFDVNVLVTAVAGGPHSFWSWPSPPPLAGNVAANCVGIVNDAQEFSLWLSPHVITNLLKVFAALDWEEEPALATCECSPRSRIVPAVRSSTPEQPKMTARITKTTASSSLRLPAARYSSSPTILICSNRTPGEEFRLSGLLGDLRRCDLRSRRGGRADGVRRP